jgi:hypothetical protein
MRNLNEQAIELALVAIVYLILDVTNRLVGGARKQNSAVYQ